MTDTIRDRIRRAGARTLRVSLADGTERTIAIDSTRGAVSRAARLLESLPWVRIEAHAADGALVDAWERGEPADADAQAPVDDPVARQVQTISAETRRHAELLRQMMADALSAQRDTIAMLRDLVRDLAQTHSEAVAAIREAVIADARAEIAESARTNGEDETTKLLTQVVAGALAAPSAAEKKQ